MVEVATVGGLGALPLSYTGIWCLEFRDVCMFPELNPGPLDFWFRRVVGFEVRC